MNESEMHDSAAEVWLLDTSGSMQGARIRLLTEAVAKYRRQATGIRLFAFSDEVRELRSVEDIGEPEGGTHLHLAIERAAALMAGRVVIFTDGEPSDSDACFAAAAKLPGTVDTVYCGDEGDRDARAFCAKLARDNGGRTATRDILKGQSLECGEVRDLLGLPAPTAL
jgi:hypothetical protein